MSMESLLGAIPFYKEEKKDSNTVIHPPGKKGKKKGIAAFFRSLNPSNWFNELSNISITLEELGSTKK